MVKHIKKIAVLTMAAMLLLVGCRNLTNGTRSGDPELSGTQSVYVTLNKDVSRALAPAALDLATTTEIKYYKITGVSLMGYNYTYAAAAADSTNGINIGDNKILYSALAATGGFELTGLVLDDWNLTLEACDDSGNTILKGTSYCALKSSSVNTVAFTLSSYGLETTAGSYKITIKYTNTNSSWKADTYSITWGLYSTTTGQSLALTGGTTAGSAQAVAKTTADTITSTGIEAEKTGVTPGNYMFGVYLMNGDNVLGFASEPIVIEPGRETAATFTIGEIISTVPKAPTHLIAQKIEGSEDDEFYNVRFAWVDESDNETQFVLVLNEVADTATANTEIGTSIDSTTFAGLAGTYTVLRYNTVLTNMKETTDDSGNITRTPSEIRYVAGSLYAGSNELVLKFPTGRMWDAQIIAMNDIGYSTACLREADTADGAGVTYTANLTITSANISTNSKLSAMGSKTVTGYGLGASAPYERINLVKISYNLDGGALKTSSTNTYPGSTYVEYVIYKKNLAADTNDDKYIKLYEIKTLGGSDYPQLSKKDVAFTEWRVKNSSNEYEAAEYNTNGFRNITAKAVYGAITGNINISSVSVEDKATLAAADVLAYYGSNATSTNSTNDAKNATIKIARGGSAQYITVSVNQTANSSTFAYFRLYVGGTFMEEIKATGSGQIYFPNFSTDYLTLGSNTQVTVAGITATGKTDSQSFYIKLANQ